jgi:high-affinity Fe2+/Pb2+ permease
MMANQKQKSQFAHEFWRILRFSLYAGFFVASVGLLFALYGIYATLWSWPNSWVWLLFLLGSFALGFLATFCALLDFRGLGKKDVM